MSEGPITTQGTIIDRINEHTFHVSLPNGKIIIAHVPLRLKELSPILKKGDKTHLELTTFDFDKARIEGLVEQTTI